MTITTLPARNEYTATAGQTLFNYTFKIYADTDLQVFVTPSGNDANDTNDEVTGFSVTGAGDEDGGTITLASAASAGDLVTIVSNIPYNRTVDYQDNGDFLPDTVNADVDRVVSLTKQSEDVLNRTLVGQKSLQNASPLTIPSPSAGEYLKWKGDESGLENTTVIEDGTVSTGTSVGDVVVLIDDGSGNGVFPDGQLNLLDEDDMVSDSDTKASTQQAVKAYTDAHIIDEDDMVSDSATKPPSQQSAKVYINLAGSQKRALFEVNSVTPNTDMDLSSGRYFHSGTTDQIIYWDSLLTYRFTTLAANKWSYLYIDDSAVVTADTNLLTATELIDVMEDTSTPTWSASKGGWYNGDDLCIFAVLGDGSGNMVEFIHTGDLVMFADAIAVETGYAGTDAFGDISPFTMPTFANTVLAYILWEHGNNQAEILWRTKGQTGTVGHEISKAAASAIRNSTQFIAITNASHIIQLKESTTTTSTADVDQDGWFLPIGM